MTARRFYRLEPLAEAVREPFPSLGRLLGLSGSSWKVVRDRGASLDAAERYALRLGVHPFTVWPEMAEDVVEKASVRCAGCDDQFVPSRKGHRFCSDGCYHRWYSRQWKRRKYATDPEFRAEELDRARKYREEAGRAIRLREAAYREQRREELREKRRAYYWRDPERHRAAQRAYEARKRAERDVA